MKAASTRGDPSGISALIINNLQLLHCTECLTSCLGGKESHLGGIIGYMGVFCLQMGGSNGSMGGTKVLIGSLNGEMVYKFCNLGQCVGAMG